jgi:type II secretory pathway pseudopilin PulG
MRKMRDEQGFALVSAIVLLVVIMGLGLGLLLLVDNQQKASARETAKEAAFNVAEAALNAQVGQISRAWPLSGGVSSCTPSTSYSASSYCPTPESLKIGYEKNVSPVACPAGTPTDAWGSPLTNQWTTYVREPQKESTLFESAVEKGKPEADTEGLNKLWIRSVGVVQCQVVSLVTLVSRQLVATKFPENAVTANWFETTNNGKKVLVDTQGKEAQPAGVSMRCTGFTGTKKEIKEKCEKYREGQVSPDTTETTAPSPSSTWTASQLAVFKKGAEAAGTYYPAGTCPSGLPSGTQVYVEGPCEVTGGSNETANSEASPGFLVIVNGTFSMNGTPTFYGVVYLVNKQESSSALVSLHGNAHLVGAITIDGNGGVEFGSSHENLEFNGKAIKELKVYAGATPTRNTFRELPINQ